MVRVTSKAKYRRAIISFLDLLGFSNLIESGSASPSDIVKILGWAKKTARHSATNAREYDLKFVSFSDSLIRITPIDSEMNTKNPVGLLLYEMQDLMQFQIEMVRVGFPVRGAVTIGEVYADKGQYFGPGLVRAYRLESELANYPRIIVDASLLSEIEMDPLLVSKGRGLSHDYWAVSDQLCQADDGLWHIDYIRKSCWRHADNYFEFLQSHAEMIRSNLTSAATGLREKQKWSWLAHYHNRCIGVNETELMKKVGITCEELHVVIPSEVSFRFPSDVIDDVD